MAENPLTKLPLWGQLVIAVVLVGVIGGAFYYFYWKGAVEQEATKRKDLAKLGDDIRQLEIIRNRQQEFMREVEQRKARLETLKRILPADKETPELMKKVQLLANASDLQIRKFNPGATTTKFFEPPPATKPGAAVKPSPTGSPSPPAQDSYQEWPINIELEGTFHNLGLFLDKVSRLTRLVNVGNLRVRNQPNQKPSNTIQVSCVATTYVYVEARTPAPAGAR